jgi:hypothetical protein
MKRMNEDYEPAFDFIVLRDRLPEATMNSPHRTRLRLGPMQLPTAILNHLATSPTPRAQSFDQARVARFVQQVMRGNRR